MKQLIIFLLIALSYGFSNAREYVYEVGTFDRISQLGNINVVYRNVPDSIGLVCYYSDTDFSDAIEITNNKGKLNIRETNNHDLGKIPTLYVYSPYLTHISNEGKSTLEAYLSITTPTLSINLIGNGTIVCEGISAPEVNASLTTGNGTIVLRGNTDWANYKLMGTGLIQADGLEAKNVKCSALGTGSIGCWAVDNLDIRGMGTTKIYYLGNPTITKKGGSTLTPMQ